MSLDDENDDGCGYGRQDAPQPLDAQQAKSPSLGAPLALYDNAWAWTKDRYAASRVVWRDVAFEIE